MPKRLLLDKQICPEFLAQGPAVDAENAGSLTLVTSRIVHDGFEQGSFNLADYQIVQITRPVTVQGRKVLIKCVFSVFAKRFLAVLGREVLRHVLFLSHVGKFPKNSFVNLACSEARSTRTT